MSSAAPSVPTGNGVHAPAAQRVLVVDDETALRLVVGRGLARCGYDVFVAASGADALAQLAREPGVDAVVSDIMMPAMTGIELAVEILRRYPGLPILFFSASEAPVELLANPLVDLIGKPAPMADLAARLDALLRAAAAVANTAPAAFAVGSGSSVADTAASMPPGGRRLQGGA